MHMPEREQGLPFLTTLNQQNNKIVEHAHYCMSFHPSRRLEDYNNKAGNVLKELTNSVHNFIFSQDPDDVPLSDSFGLNAKELAPLLPVYREIVHHLNNKDFEKARQLLASEELAGVEKYPFLFVSYLASNLSKGNLRNAMSANTLELLSEYALPNHRFPQFVSRTFYTDINEFLLQTNRDLNKDPFAKHTYQHLLQQSNSAKSLQEIAAAAVSVQSAWFLPAFKAEDSEKDAQTSIMLKLFDKAQDALLSEDLNTPQQSEALSGLEYQLYSHFVRSPEEREQLTALNSHLIMNKEAFNLCGTQISLISWIMNADKEKGEVYAKQLLVGMSKKDAPISAKVFARLYSEAFDLLPYFDEAVHEACVLKTCQIIKGDDFNQLYVSEQKDMVKLAAKTREGFKKVSKAIFSTSFSSEKLNLIVYGGIQCARSAVRRLFHFQP